MSNLPFQSFEAEENGISHDRHLPLRGIRILLVEDEPDIADLYVLILASAGATVMIVGLSEEALMVLNYMRSDILISDVKLPDHDADWLIRRVRGHRQQNVRQLPAIAITSYPREVCRERILEAGFEQLMTKLTDPEDLIQAVKNLVG